MSDSDDFVAAFMKKKEQLRTERTKAFFDALDPKTRDILMKSVDDTKWSSLEEMNAALAKKRATEKKAPPKPVDPEYRRREIEYELNIIRGSVPTPKGYKVDGKKIKALMTELGELEAKGEVTT